VCVLLWEGFHRYNGEIDIGIEIEVGIEKAGRLGSQDAATGL